MSTTNTASNANNAPQPEITETKGNISEDVLLEKYAQKNEKTADDVYQRVARGLASVEKTAIREQMQESFYANLKAGAIGAGRIMATCGTDVEATLINCFIQPVDDCISAESSGKGHVGIYDAIRQAAETMRRGGGVGYDFSPIRPAGSLVRSTNSYASGPCSYIDVFDASCRTVESAGFRRGAQMGVLRIDHPDVFEFIQAKRTKGRWNNFNVSVGVTDEFMQALKDGKDFALAHAVPPHSDSGIPAATMTRNGETVHVYKVVKAQELWDTIMQSAYDYAEPGILFLDTINANNNLNYCETIHATNPCGEQPLPPYGCCDLGPIILPKFVTGTPFTGSASFDWKAFKNAVALQVRALDNVLTLTRWPLKQQQEEAHNKRRIGVGFTGLGTTLLLLGMGYTSQSSYRFMQTLAETMRDAAYAASVELAKERGPFPLFSVDKYMQSPFIKNLPQKLQKDIKRYGIRNSHLLSIAPTGTVSLAFADNCSNGIEPPFSWEYRRKKRNGDGTSTIYDVREHAYAVWREMHGDKPLPDYFKTALELSVQEHIKPMEIIQPYIDSAISKTVNVPADYPFEQFKDLYLEAYNRGLKGVATYRPNDTLGGVLLTAEPKKEPAPQTLASSVDSRVIEHRPSGPLSAISEKITYWTQEGKKVIYLIVSFMEHNGETRAIEFFLPVGHLHESQQWLTSSMRLLSLAARGGFLQSALENMRNTRWDTGPIRYGFYTKQDGTLVPRYHNSEVSLIAYAIEELVKRVKDSGLPFTTALLQATSSSDALVENAKENTDAKDTKEQTAKESKEAATQTSDSTLPASFPSNASTCPECGAAAVVKRDGCSTCLNCGYVGACG